MRRLLLLLFITTSAVGQKLPTNHICRLRCIAKCMNDNKEPLQQCTQQCISYDNQKLCDNPDCWKKCLDLDPMGVLPIPSKVKIDTDNGDSLLSWSNVNGATLYAVEYKLPNAPRFDGDDYMITTSTGIKNFQNPKGSICDDSVVMIMAISESAVSDFTKPVTVNARTPYVDPTLNISSLVYINKPLKREGYTANGTLELTFSYKEGDWPLGTSDLIVEPLFHTVNCVTADLSQAIPVPDFEQGVGNTVVGYLGSDLMYRQCRIMYYVSTVRSRACRTYTSIQAPLKDTMRTYVIDCDAVANAPCKKEVRHDPPLCGMVDDVNFTVLTPNVRAEDKALDLVLNVSFVPVMRSNEAPTLYYVAFYGPATNYSSDDEKAFLGVNMTSIMGNTTNCFNYTETGTCAHHTDLSVIIQDIHLDSLYGITFCAVKDPKNLNFSGLLSPAKSIRPKTNPILVNSSVLHETLTHSTSKPADSSDNCFDSVELTIADEIVDLLSRVEPEWDSDDQQLFPENYQEVLEQVRMHKRKSTLTLMESTEAFDENETRILLEDSYDADFAEENFTMFHNYSDSSTKDFSGDFNITDSTLILIGNVSEPFVYTNFSSTNSSEETELWNTTSTVDVSTSVNTITSSAPTKSDYAGKSPVGLIIGVVVGALCLVVIGILGMCYYINKRQKAKNEKFRLKITQLELEKEGRYTDFPKKFDIWEVERRNLIIHNDKKLGSGAFGAVYLGKLLGKSLAHKDANSPLGVNLMRAENCDVAVKMLPEYADDISKSEFLREIGLMKTLGYHERLVNMLACITDSEPLCLIVEYCSDGDLLHFLRSRCKYMMKLDELGIDYHQAPLYDNYDPQMIITLKQLLMFAVQVSYGLEYLSQKGFVHRDVAARNILVHEMNSCKIGDFGLCRYIYSENSHYKSKGGRLPLKWMSPEAIRHYEFSTQSDVWSFGILLFEIITLGGSPYPGVQPEDMLTFLESGGRMEQPDNCPDEFYNVMDECWRSDPEHRIEFSQIRQKLASQLEDITDEYSYLKLDAQKDYYNVQYGDQKPDVIIVPEDVPLKLKKDKVTANYSLSSVESIPRDSNFFDPNDDIDRMKAANKLHQEEDTQSSVITDSMSISMGAVSDSNV